MTRVTTCVFACVLRAALSAGAADIGSIASGAWHHTNTWAGSVTPSAGDNVTIAVGHTVTVAEASMSYTVSNLTVNGMLTHTNNNGVSDPHYKIDLTILGDLTVNGSISADGKGYDQQQGPAPGGNLHGARHGGLGGASSEADANLYTTYGSVTNPTTLGSGGGIPAGLWPPTCGGGAVILRVSGTTAVNAGARVSAEGARSRNFASAGAGGSVNLRTASLSGGGLIQANGGLQDPAGNVRYGGGGGRVAVRLTASDTFGSVTNQAFGGYGNYGQNNRGAPGTVYLQTASQGEGNGAVIVDNWGLTSPAFVTTAISSNVTDATTATLIVTNTAVFTIGSNAAFTVASNFLNHGQTASLGAGGTLAVGGAGTCTFGGSVAPPPFHHLMCTNAGKRIEFPAGQAMRLAGALTLAGAPGNEIELVGAGGGTWNLDVPSPFAGSVSYVDATNSDASAGATIAAYDSIDRGGNVNWSFGSFATLGETNTWIGASGPGWGTVANWDLGRLPVETDFVRIWTNNSPADWPIMNDHKKFQTLWIGPGAQMSLGGYDLWATTNLVVAGTLAATGSETLTLEGDADLNGGTWTAASSTVVIAGPGAQTLDFTGIAFNALRVQNTAVPLTISGAFSASAIDNQGADLTFAGAVVAGVFASVTGDLTFNAAVTATDFTCTAPGATLTFKDGATVAVTNLTLIGAAGGTLTLVSSSPGTKWNLGVAAASFVGRVTVSDSDASGGMTIRPVASAEGTPSSTVNWDFGAGPWQAWTGATADLTNAANWNPAGEPDAASRLYVETTAGVATPALGTALTVRELAVGGAVGATAVLNAPLTVTNRVAILPGGTLTHANNAASPQFNLDLTVGGDLEIAAGGAIDVDGKGFQSYAGPAPGKYGGNPWYGAGHGGLGGHDVNHAPSPYVTYGSVTNPVTLGSGGAAASGNETPGGGAAILRVGGRTYIDEGGAISANAPDAPGFWRGGGAGGSVNLVTATLAGNGVIQAHGGRGTVVGGGGGRVAVRLTGGNSFGGVAITAHGGLDGYITGPRYGAAGTVYRQTASQGHGDLVVDNNAYSTPADVTTLVSSNVTDATVGDVLIRNAGRFAVAGDVQVDVYGAWSNAATFSAATNGVVNLLGAGTEVVYGDSQFGTLRITTKGKTVRFEAGSTNSVDGALQLRDVTLRSTADGAWWYLDLSTNAVQDVRAVTVQDGNASNGATIVALPTSRDLGHNVNWLFPLAPGSVVLLR